MKQTPRPENVKEGKREHNPLELAGRTAQLLLMGSVIAVTGLLFSFSMVVFRVTCDSKFYIPDKMYIEEGKPEVCKSTPRAEPMPRRSLDHKHLDGQVAEVSWKGCTHSENCTAFQQGFCAGGPEGVSQKDYCDDHACVCHSVIWDCGYSQSFVVEYKVDQIVQDCRTVCHSPSKCDETVTVVIPKWTLHRTNILGCESKRKTDLMEALHHIQTQVQILGVVRPLLKEEDDEVWHNLTGDLEKTADISYNFFWPSTISESVASEMSPEQKIFVGFMLCAALSLFRSDYTTECHTVDLPKKAIPFIHVEWNTIRAWLPPIGLILLSMVQMVPFSEIFDAPHGLMTIVHLVGAQFCFVVYLVAEAAALDDQDNRKEMKQAGEHPLRLILCVLGFFSMGVFALSYLTLTVFSGKGENPYVRQPVGGFSDMYERNSATRESYLVRPASGKWQVLKMISYFAEMTVAMSILLNQLVIWWFFQRRLNKLHEGNGGGDADTLLEGA